MFVTAGALTGKCSTNIIGVVGIRTDAVHAGEERTDGALAAAIHRSSTYELGDPKSFDDIRYIRLNNTPSQQSVERKLGALEGGDALVTPSGTAAIWIALSTYVEVGSTILAPTQVYGGTRKVLDDLEERGLLRARYVDLHDPESWNEALDSSVRAFYAESLSNPWMGVGALDKLIELCRERRLTSIVDNTLLTPVFFRPLEFGFDVVIHSASKHLNGHTDVVAGVVAARAPLVHRARLIANRYGICPDPQACFLLNRGVKTLPLRVRAQAASAMELALALGRHELVESVSYPGLPQDESHARSRAWFDGHGTMLAFRPRIDAKRLIQSLRLPTEAPSLGGVETLITRPATTTHAGISRDLRIEMGIHDNDVRVSVGVEDTEDLIEDFEHALRRASDGS